MNFVQGLIVSQLRTPGNKLLARLNARKVLHQRLVREALIEVLVEQRGCYFLVLFAAIMAVHPERGRKVLLKVLQVLLHLFFGEVVAVVGNESRLLWLDDVIHL